MTRSDRFEVALWLGVSIAGVLGLVVQVVAVVLA